MLVGRFGNATVAGFKDRTLYVTRLSPVFRVTIDNI